MRMVKRYTKEIVICEIGYFVEFVCEVIWNNGGLFFEPVKPEFYQKFVIWEHIIYPEAIGNFYETPEFIN